MSSAVNSISRMSCKQMACNGMASSSSFSSTLMLPLQAPYEEENSLTNPLIPPDLQKLRGQLLALGSTGAAPASGKRSMSFPGIETAGDDDLSDDGSVAGEKKKRLNVEQVRALEKSFEVGNKLEPDRKVQLARALGLRPRQVAIWFQNRRARWKTKQLERDYDVLKAQLQAMRTVNESLLAHNKKLQAEILALRGRETPELINLNKDTEGSCSNRSENSCSEINLDLSRASVKEGHIPAPQILPHFQTIKPAGIDQLLHNSCKPEFQCPKVESDGGAAPEGSFSNLLCSMLDQSVFWPWPDHHSFH